MKKTKSRIKEIILIKAIIQEVVEVIAVVVEVMEEAVEVTAVVVQAKMKQILMKMIWMKI